MQLAELLPLLFLLHGPVIADICTHCQCDFSSQVVTCIKPSLLVRTVSLFPSIRQLHLTGLKLPQPPHFLFHSGLSVLRMNRCGVQELSAHTLLPLPGLEVVDLSANQLETLPPTLLRGLKKLRVLILANNRISNLADIAWILAEGVVLEQLDLSGNRIHSSNALTILPPTRQLLMSDVGMSNIDENAMIFAESDACPSSRSCRQLPLRNLNVSILTTLDLAANHNLDIGIGLLDLLRNVSFFDLSFAKLPDGFDKWLEERSRVRSLNVSHAQVKLEDHEWRTCGQMLHSLDISGIGARRLRLPRFCPLRTLFARDNLLAISDIAAVSLESLHLDRNMFDDLPTPSTGVELSNLHTLSVSNNLLTSLRPHALQGYPNLQHLDLSHNQIGEIDAAAFPSIGMELISLDLSSNQLSVLPHPVLPSLLLLDLSSNNLVFLDPVFFTGLPMLQQLRLASNPTLFSRCEATCWSDHLDELTSLVDLDLSNCGLSNSLHLTHLSALRSLLLRGNQIRTMDADSLPKTLRTLDLGENRIQFTSNFTKLGSLRDLRVDLNPLRCDCSLTDVVPHLLNQSQITDPTFYFCFAGSWQYPLLPYLTTVQPCVDSTRSFFPILIATFTFSITVVCILIMLFLLFKKYSDSMRHVYKRLATDLPVRMMARVQMAYEKAASK
ncbi:unnamed protein product [Caenorhabditis auriculariae]|uniref:LRRCT domain-containing protein n=1 Tax=Caenorhabditis auriculariae TaxID=2777116 RepID=A0A8S1GQD1_9PELO|nr:unnamed protein product [Caenorhabditis auriculariae]